MKKSVLKLSGDSYMKAVAPGGEQNDCTVRAMSKAFDVPYEEAHKFLLKNGRKPKRGVAFRLVIGEKPRTIFKKRIAFHKARGTVATFLKRHPKGVYIVTVTRHVFAVKDGVVLGRENVNKRILSYYFISEKKCNTTVSPSE